MGMGLCPTRASRAWEPRYYHAIATLTENTEARRRLETVPYVLPDTEFSSFVGVSRQVILIR